MNTTIRTSAWYLCCMSRHEAYFFSVDFHMNFLAIYHDGYICQVEPSGGHMPQRAPPSCTRMRSNATLAYVQYSPLLPNTTYVRVGMFHVPVRSFPPSPPPKHSSKHFPGTSYYCCMYKVHIFLEVETDKNIIHTRSVMNYVTSTKRIQHTLHKASRARFKATCV